MTAPLFTQGQRARLPVLTAAVAAGQPLVSIAAIYATNTASFASVEVVGGDSVEPGEALIKVTAPEA